MADTWQQEKNCWVRYKGYVVQPKDSERLKKDYDWSFSYSTVLKNGL